MSGRRFAGDGLDALLRASQTIARTRAKAGHTERSRQRVEAQYKAAIKRGIIRPKYEIVPRSMVLPGHDPLYDDGYGKRLARLQFYRRSLPILILSSLLLSGDPVAPEPVPPPAPVGNIAPAQRPVAAPPRMPGVESAPTSAGTSRSAIGAL